MTWIHLFHRLTPINLSRAPDVFRWKLHISGVFSIKSMYADLINTGQVFRKQFIWKVKVPLKIKIFMWYLEGGVVLTKDNLAKHRWQGYKKCYFCDKEETIQHLFLACPFATIHWRTIHVSYNLPSPTSITNMFGNWLAGIHPKLKAQICVGVCSLVWAIWNCRNDCVFNRTKLPHFLQVIFRATS